MEGQASARLSSQVKALLWRGNTIGRMRPLAPLCWAGRNAEFLFCPFFRPLFIALPTVQQRNKIFY